MSQHRIVTTVIGWRTRNRDPQNAAQRNTELKCQWPAAASITHTSHTFDTVDTHIHILLASVHSITVNTYKIC